MKLSVILLLSFGTVFMSSYIECTPTPAPSPFIPYTVLPPIGKGHRKIGKLSLLKNRVRYDLFSSLLYKSLLIDKQHNYLTSKSLKIK